MGGIVLQIVFLLSISMTVISPHIGVLVYYWFTWLNPHRLVYGLLPLDWGKIIALTTIICILFSKEKKRIPANTLIITVIVLFLWTTVTTFFAKYPDAALSEYIDFAKVITMSFIIVILINTKTKLHALVWVVSISIGFFAVKGGMFTIISGGNYYVYGPPSSHIFNTNEIARAFLMCLPLTYYLSIQSYYIYVRYAMSIVSILTIVAIFGTTSRTVFLVLLVVLFFGWLRRDKKLKIGILGIVAGIAILVALPEERFEGLSEKYRTSSEYETDTSFQGRVFVWNYIVQNLAESHPIAGGGFKAVVNDLKKEPHSSYFQMLGEHGYVGLTIYLFLSIATLLKTNKIYRVAKRNPNLTWAKDLALMIQLSFIGYFLGGVTKNAAFFEFYYMLIGMTVVLEELVAKEVRKIAPSSTPIVQSAK